MTGIRENVVFLLTSNQSKFFEHHLPSIKEGLPHKENNPISMQPSTPAGNNTDFSKDFDPNLCWPLISYHIISDVSSVSPRLV
jgi:hypothetical protein